MNFYKWHLKKMFAVSKKKLTTTTKNQSNNKEFYVYSDFIYLNKFNVLFGINIPYMGTVELFAT